MTPFEPTAILPIGRRRPRTTAARYDARLRTSRRLLLLRHPQELVVGDLGRRTVQRVGGDVAAHRGEPLRQRQVPDRFRRPADERFDGVEDREVTGSALDLSAGAFPAWSVSRRGTALTQAAT